jgi:hypothetical protein
VSGLQTSDMLDVGLYRAVRFLLPPGVIIRAMNGRWVDEVAVR